MLQWAYGLNNSKTAVKKCITSTMTDFSMPDVNQIMFLRITKAQDWCYAFGRSCRESRGPTAASKSQPHTTVGVPDHLKIFSKQNAKRSNAVHYAELAKCQSHLIEVS